MVLILGSKSISTQQVVELWFLLPPVCLLKNYHTAKEGVHIVYIGNLVEKTH